MTPDPPAGPTHDAAEFNDIIHNPVRLRLCALLSSADNATFPALRDELGVADSVLSKHLRTLTQAGYVTTTKIRGHSQHRTTHVELTPHGRRAFNNHIQALHDILQTGPD